MHRRTAILIAMMMAATGGLAAAQEPALADSLAAVSLTAAESSVDSLRAELRRLDKNLQAMKQDLTDGADMDRFFQVLSGETEPDAPEETRSRRQRLDDLLKTISQRPGQLRFNGSSTGVMQSLVGGETEGTAATSSVDLYAHTSFGPQTLLFFAFEAGGGEGVDGWLPVATPVNGDAVSTRSNDGFNLLVMNEAWAEFTALGEAVTVTVGKIDLTNYFDINMVANDETAQFLAGELVNSAALLVPEPGPGVRARTVLLHRLTLQAGVTSADSLGGSQFRDAFGIASVGVRPFPDTYFNGNLRAYIYAPAHVNSARGWGLSADQSLANGYTIFGRFGHNDEELVGEGQASQAWSAGLQWERSWRERPLTLAVAYGRSHLLPAGHETIVETYVSWQVNTWTHVSPHLQWVHNDLALTETATVAGLRVQFNF